MKNLYLFGFIVSFMLTSPILALIDAQALVGQRNGTMKLSNDGSQDVSGSEVKIAAHIDPIPLIPIAFGVYMATADLGDAGSLKGLKGTEFGAEVMAWLPVGLAGFKPYVKIGYTPFGAYKGDYEVSGQKLSTAWGASGSRIAGGIKYSPLPLIALLFEVEQASMKLDFDEIKDAAGFSPDLLPNDDSELSSLGIFLGLEVGI